MNLKNIDKAKQLLGLRENLNESLKVLVCVPDDALSINGCRVTPNYRRRLRETIENELKTYIKEVEDELRSL